MINKSGRYGGTTLLHMHRQPSLFGVDATNPSPGDLAGLLAGPGELGRMGGTARVSVTVDAAWRVHALLAEFGARQLPGTWEPGPDAWFVVRTAYTTRIAGLAAAWSAGPPSALHLNGPALRLWVAAAGTSTEDAFLLRLGPATGSWPAVGAALSAAGISAALLTSAPAYRITGRRRLARLAELVGDPPPTAPADTWPH